MKQSATIFILGLGHGLNDFVAGYLLGSLLNLHLPVVQVSLCFLVYNALAFGGQYFVALWVASVVDLKKIYSATWLMNTVAVISFFYLPQLSFVLAGCASAVYHVIGGTVAAHKQKASAIGIFAAPGIIGLAAAGYLAATGANLWWALVLLTLVFATSGMFFSLNRQDASEPEKHKPGFDKHDGLMILLLTIITLRSALWNVFQLLHQHNYMWLLAIAVSAFIGKILGGFISDRIGWRLYNLLSLGLSAPLVSFFKYDLVLFCIGIALLQSGIPATTALLLQSIKGRKEKGIGLSFGTAVFMAGLLSMAMSWLNSGTGLFALLLLTILLSSYVVIMNKKPFINRHKPAVVNKLLSPAKRLVLKPR